MDLKAKRKKRLVEFTIKESGTTGFFMAILFLFGLYLSWTLSVYAKLLYLLFWVVSFFLIHGMTCRNCVYHGKHCPVPFEGSCSDTFFSKGKGFGLISTIGVILTYSLRICIPYVAIYRSGSISDFISYTTVFLLFFYVLIFHTGCPNCINLQCPMNPEHS